MRLLAKKTKYTYYSVFSMSIYYLFIAKGKNIYSNNFER
jgi:hypothetical protein